MTKPPDSPRPPDDRAPSFELIEAAAAWLSLRDRGISPAETTEFVRWLQHDPRHATVFTELDAVWNDFDRLVTVPASSPASANSSLLPPDADLLAPRTRSRHHRMLTWATLPFGAAAVALLLLTASSLRMPRHTAETAVGAFQKFDLPDGSVAQINTDSAIDTAFIATERRIRLVRGEVFSQSPKTPRAPFVTSGPVAVRAVGTAFNVRQRAVATEVLVTVGRVRVDDAHAGHSLLPATSSAPATEPPLLVAGERATVLLSSTSSASITSPAPATTATVEKIAPPAAQRALAWQERRLEFDASPLAEVAREFDRYNRQQLVIPDAPLSAKRFSGTFRADAYESLVRLLETDFVVTATRTDREIVLRSRS